MATQYEQYNNSAFTYLQTDISDSDLLIIVYDVRRFPLDANFRIRVGNELMRVTSVDVNTKTLTVTRAVEGTVARTHALGDLLICILTQGGLDQMLTDRVLYAKQRPQYGQLSDDTGAKAEVADFTWHNQGSATAIDVAGTIWMDGLRDIGVDARCLFLSTPGTPWTFTLGWRPFLSSNSSAPASFARAGVVLKNTGNARLILFGNGILSTDIGSVQTLVRDYNSASSSSTIQKREDWSRRFDDVMWHRVTDDGTNLVYDTSRDGVNWEQFFTQGRTAWLTSGPNQVGFFIDPAGADVSFGANMNNYASFVHVSFT